MLGSNCHTTDFPNAREQKELRMKVFCNQGQWKIRGLHIIKLKKNLMRILKKWSEKNQSNLSFYAIELSSVRCDEKTRLDTRLPKSRAGGQDQRLKKG